jgi:hypothetical protein
MVCAFCRAMNWKWKARKTKSYSVPGLDGHEYRSAIHGMTAMGIVGATFYDGLIAACAIKARADQLYT